MPTFCKPLETGGQYTPPPLPPVLLAAPGSLAVNTGALALCLGGGSFSSGLEETEVTLRLEGGGTAKVEADGGKSTL